MILFLDFDGVTHPQPCFQENVFCRLPLIEEVIREFAQVKIVISSSWREHYSQDDMQEFFAPDTCLTARASCSRLSRQTIPAEGNSLRFSYAVPMACIDCGATVKAAYWRRATYGPVNPKWCAMRLKQACEQAAAQWQKTIGQLVAG